MIQPGTTPTARGPRRRRVAPPRARLGGMPVVKLRNSVASRRATILIASWAMVVAAAYFVLNDEIPATAEAGAGATLLALIAVNFALGWMQPETVVAPQY